MILHVLLLDHLIVIKLIMLLILLMMMMRGELRVIKAIRLEHYNLILIAIIV